MKHVVIFAGITILSLLVGCSSNPTPEIEANTTVTSNSAYPQEEAWDNASTVTLYEFNQIQPGLPYELVRGIIGGEGVITSESTLGDIHTVMYQYKGEGEIGANAIFMFQNNELITKSQYGLK